MTNINDFDFDDNTLFKAYCAGFEATGDGYNGEYPFGTHGISITSDRTIRETFLEWYQENDGPAQSGDEP